MFTSSGVVIGAKLSAVVIGICAGVILLTEALSAAQLAGLLAMALAFFFVHHALGYSYNKSSVNRDLERLRGRFADVTSADLLGLQRISRVLGYQVL